MSHACPAQVHPLAAPHYASGRPMTAAEMMAMENDDVWKSYQRPDEVTADDGGSNLDGGMELVNLGAANDTSVPTLTPPPRKSKPKSNKKNKAHGEETAGAAAVDADQVHVDVK